MHEAGGKIAMQILHAGRYAYHPLSVAPSAIRSPITPFKPRALSDAGIRKTIADFARCAELARRAGYDGVEVMGSEGYLINQFVVARTNHRDDAWGGAYANRMRFAVDVVRATRAAVGRDFILIYRLSMLDLVEGGSTWDEVVQLAQAVASWTRAWADSQLEMFCWLILLARSWRSWWPRGTPSARTRTSSSSSP